jgi:hypothetical protein
VAQPYQLLEHRVARLLHERVDVLRGHALGADRREDADVDDAGAERALLDVQDVCVVCNDDGDDGDLGLDGEVERALFEGQQLRLVGVGARALGEDEDGLALGAHRACGRVEGGAGGGAVCAVDEDGFGERHWGVISGEGRDGEKGRERGRDALNQPRMGAHFSDFFAVTEVYCGNMEPSMRTSSSLWIVSLRARIWRGVVQRRSQECPRASTRQRSPLVVAQKHGRPRQQRVLAAAVRHAKGDARDPPHAPLERPPGRPLAQAPVAHNPQKDAREHAIQGAHAHQDHASYEEGRERGKLRQLRREDEGQHAQQDDEDRRGGHGVNKPAHGGWWCGRGGFYTVVGSIQGNVGGGTRWGAGGRAKTAGEKAVKGRAWATAFGGASTFSMLRSRSRGSLVLPRLATDVGWDVMQGCNSRPVHSRACAELRVVEREVVARLPCQSVIF